VPRARIDGTYTSYRSRFVGQPDVANRGRAVDVRYLERRRSMGAARNPDGPRVAPDDRAGALSSAPEKGVHPIGAPRQGRSTVRSARRVPPPARPAGTGIDLVGIALPKPRMPVRETPPRCKAPAVPRTCTRDREDRRAPSDSDLAEMIPRRRARIAAPSVLAGVRRRAMPGRNPIDGLSPAAGDR
jgi:hypothetical protein